MLLSHIKERMKNSNAGTYSSTQWHMFKNMNPTGQLCNYEFTKHSTQSTNLFLELEKEAEKLTNNWWNKKLIFQGLWHV